MASSWCVPGGTRLPHLLLVLGQEELCPQHVVSGRSSWALGRNGRGNQPQPPGPVPHSRGDPRGHGPAGRPQPGSSLVFTELRDVYSSPLDGASGSGGFAILGGPLGAPVALLPPQAPGMGRSGVQGPQPPPALPRGRECTGCPGLHPPHRLGPLSPARATPPGSGSSRW